VRGASARDDDDDDDDESDPFSRIMSEDARPMGDTVVVASRCLILKELWQSEVTVK